MSHGYTVFCWVFFFFTGVKTIFTRHKFTFIIQVLQLFVMSYYFFLSARCVYYFIYVRVPIQQQWHPQSRPRSRETVVLALLNSTVFFVYVFVFTFLFSHYIYFFFLRSKHILFISHDWYLYRRRCCFVHSCVWYIFFDIKTLY